MHLSPSTTYMSDFSDAFLSRNTDRAKKYTLGTNGPIRKPFPTEALNARDANEIQRPSANTVLETMSLHRGRMDNNDTRKSGVPSRRNEKVIGRVEKWYGVAVRILGSCHWS